MEIETKRMGKDGKPLKVKIKEEVVCPVCDSECCPGIQNPDKCPEYGVDYE